MGHAGPDSMRNVGGSSTAPWTCWLEQWVREGYVCLSTWPPETSTEREREARQMFFPAIGEAPSCRLAAPLTPHKLLFRLLVAGAMEHHAPGHVCWVGACGCWMAY